MKIFNKILKVFYRENNREKQLNNECPPTTFPKIYGHPTKGNEVIRTLEMLGGLNKKKYKGNENVLFCIDNNGCIIETYDWTGYKYTIEEFQKIYPHKVGDNVLYRANQVQFFKTEILSMRVCYYTKSIQYITKDGKFYADDLYKYRG